MGGEGSKAEAPLVQALGILSCRPELTGVGGGLLICALCPPHTPQGSFILSFNGVLSQNTEAKPPPEASRAPKARVTPLSEGLPGSVAAATRGRHYSLGARGAGASPPIPEPPGAAAPPSWR